jgi:ribosome biogenesis GTPase
VVRLQSGFYTIQTESGVITCHLRGRFKQGPRLGDVIAVGDWVEISLQAPDKGMIEEIKPRSRILSRMDPTPRGLYQQIILANPDQALLMFACAQPQPRLGMLDRFLVIAEKQGIPAVIVANKVDLVGEELAKTLFRRYEEIGYPVIYTSVKQAVGVERLRDQLAQKVTVLVGPSGVGKSSLMNAIQPGLGLSVREVSQTTHKGQHTTVVRQLFALDAGGYVADTPGLKALALWDVQPEELDGYFPEIRARVAECPFSDCTHLHEPGCAVLAALGAGEIHPERYRAYVNMRSGLMVD